jgi:hypothetical protein
MPGNDRLHSLLVRIVKLLHRRWPSAVLRGSFGAGRLRGEGVEGVKKDQCRPSVPIELPLLGWSCQDEAMVLEIDYIWHQQRDEGSQKRLKSYFHVTRANLISAPDFLGHIFSYGFCIFHTPVWINGFRGRIPVHSIISTEPMSTPQLFMRGSVNFWNWKMMDGLSGWEQCAHDTGGPARAPASGVRSSNQID